MATPVNDIPTAGTGDVTSSSNITDNSVVRGDGGGKGIQESSMSILDTGLMQSSVGNYETLVVADDDIPNKKYVDDLVGTTNVTSTSTITDNAILRGDGGARGAQETGIVIDDGDYLLRNGGITSIPQVTTITNGSFFPMPTTGWAGMGWIVVGDNEETATFTVTDNGTPTIWSSSGNVVTSAAGGTFSIYKDAVLPVLKLQNNLGADKDVLYWFNAFTP